MRTLRAHLLQHAPFEGLGSIGAWLEAHSAVVTATRFFEEAALPNMDDIDFLIAMGGPMSVNDEERHPWLPAEKQFIAEAIRQRKAVFGVCLGAQLIAGALGARVYPNPEKEIGWFPIHSVFTPGDARGDDVARFRFPGKCLVFHWHGETFDLPPGAVHLARSGACRNQAFQYGRRVIGLQFHLEVTPQTARDFVSGGRDELVSTARYVQPEEVILSAPGAWYAGINQLMDDLLSFLVRAEV